MKRLTRMLVLGLLAFAPAAGAYDGPGAPLTYDKTLQGVNDCIASPGSCTGGPTQQIRVEMTVQPLVINGIRARITMTAHVPVVAGTTTINLQLRRPFDTPLGYEILQNGSCTVTPSPGTTGTVAYSCSFETQMEFPSIGGQKCDAGGCPWMPGDTFQVYPFVARNGTTPTTHDGQNFKVSVPVVGDDIYEDNDSRLSATVLTLPPSNTLTLTNLRFDAFEFGGEAQGDWYQFTAPTGAGSLQARIDFWDAQCDLDIFFYEPNLNNFTTAGNSSDQDFESFSIAIAAGNTYSLQVLGAEGSCAAFYSMTVTVTAPDNIVISGPTGAPNPVAPGGSVALNVEASDSLGHALAYSWAQACSSTLTAANGGLLGVFSNRFIKSPVWDAPPNPTGSNQICNVSVTIDDGFANSGPSAKISQQYSITIAPGGDVITITTPPSGTPNTVTPPSPVSVTVAATDGFTHPLSYSWSASCPTLGGNGTFANASNATTTWTPPANATAATQSCTLMVTITDAPAGAITINPGFSVNVTPSVHTLTISAGPSGSPNAVASGGTASLSVTPIDTSGHALNYMWSANCPGLGTGTFSNNTAAAPTWTAPVNNGATQVSCTISVSINDGAFGLVVNGNYTQNVQSAHAINFTAGPTANPGALNGGGSSAVSATAADTQGHTLTYSWTASCTGGIGAGSFANSNAASTTYVAPANGTGTTQNCTLTVVANDGQGLTKSATAAVTVAAAAHTLTFSIAANGTPNPVNASALANVTATAVDSQSHTVSYAWTASCPGGNNGAFSNASTQSPTWTAPPNAGTGVLNCTLQVTASDGQGLTQTSTYTQGVNPPNHSITVTVAAAGTPNPVAPSQDVSMNVAAVDSLSHALSYAWSASCTGGIGAGTFANPTLQMPTWTSPVNSTNNIQTCTITVQISDGQGTTATSSYAQTVTTPTHTLSILAGSLKGTPNPGGLNEPIAMSVNAIDTFGHPLTYLWQASCADVPTNGTFSPSQNSAAPTWTPPNNTTGGNVSCLISLLVIDGQGLSANGSFVQTVGSQPAHTVTFSQPPSGSPNPVPSSGVVAMSATAVDTLPHSLTYAWTVSCPTLGGNGTLSNAAAQNPSWTSPQNLTGSSQNCTVTAVASDGLGKSATGTFTQVVQSVPHSLTITQNPSGTPNPVPSLNTASLSVVASDSLSHALTYAWSASCPTLSGNGTFSNAAAANTNWTAPSNNSGSTHACTITLAVNDGANGLSQTASYQQSVSSITHSLTITQNPSGAPNPVLSGGAVVLSVVAVDTVPQHTLAYQWSASCPTSPSHGSFSNAAIQGPTWTAPVNESAAARTCTISVVVNDGAGGLSQSANFTQTVNPHSLTITQQPNGTPNPVASSGAVALNVVAADTLSHTLGYQWSAICAGLSGATGSFSNAAIQSPMWTAPANLTGAAQTCAISVTVSDGAGLQQTASFTQTVNSVAHTLTITTGPSGSPNPVQVGGTAALSVAANDSLSHVVTYAWTASCPGAGSNGAFSNPALQAPTWTPPVISPGATQACTISVTASDTQGLSDTKSYTQNVNAASTHTLTIQTQPNGTPNPSGPGQPVALSVGVVDSFAHALSYLWQASCPVATNGTFSPSQGSAAPTWTPPVNNTGADLTCLISVLVIDNQGLSANASFVQRVSITGPTHTVTITTPASGTPNPVPSAGTATLGVAAADSLGHALTYAWSASCAGLGGATGTFSNAAAQNPTWTAPVNGTGSPQACTMQVVASDGQGQSATSSYTQTVSAAAAHTLTITAGPTGNPNPVTAGGSVSLSVSAVDSLAHAVTYAWTASCPGPGGNGSFANATQQNTTWTAPPNTSGNTITCTMLVTVSDNLGLQGAVAQNSYAQQVLSTGAPHTLTITAAPSGTPNPSPSGGGVAMTATAVDSLGHTVFYSWSASCPALLGGNGVFSPSAGVQTPSWQGPTNSTGVPQTCVITVAVNDAQGLSQSAIYNQTINPSNVTHSLNITVPPAGSPNPSAPSAGVALSVTAVDTLAHFLTYLWQATCAEVSGTGSFVPSATAAAPTWTPPPSPVGVDLNCLIRVQVIDGLDKTATASFIQKVQQNITPPHTVTITTSPNGTPNPVASAGTASVTVTAVDSLTHALVYTWSASCPTLSGNGSFTGGNVGQTRSWVAPANLTGVERTCTMTVIADDGQGQSVQASYTQRVSSVPHTLTITAGPSGAPNPVNPGLAVQLSATVVDSLSHALSYLWSASCTGGVAGSGTFSPSNVAAAPMWTPPVNPAGTAFSCQITLAAADNQNTTATASYTQNINAGAPPAHTVTITVPPAGTPNPVASGASVAISTTAVDSQGHTLTYLWSATCLTLPSNGSFANAATASPTWTAPANVTGSPQTCTIQVTADDLLGQTASASYAQTVSPTGGTHTINVTAPPSGTPNPVPSGGTAQLSVTAVDTQGHSLNYLWQVNCGTAGSGSLSNATVATPQWTAPVNPLTTELTCVVSVQILDGFGLSVTPQPQYSHTVSVAGSHSITITQQPSGAPDPCNDGLPPGSPPAPPCPTIESDSAVNLTVGAMDSLGHSLNYQWTATCPGLPDGGIFSPSSTVGDPTWIVPTNYTNAIKNCVIQVAVTDNFGQSATGTYPLGINVTPVPVPITVFAQTYLGKALDPAIPDDPFTVPIESNLQLPNFSVVLFRCVTTGPCMVDDSTGPSSTETDAIDAFSLSGLPSTPLDSRAREWQKSVVYAQGEKALLRIYRNVSSGFSQYWSTNSPNGLAWRTNPARQKVAEMEITIQPNAIYTISALIDLDTDGMDDSWEELYCGATPPSCEPTDDVDLDNLNTLGEFENGTNPLVADTDGDGVLDGAEVGNGDKPADATDWRPSPLRATVGNATVYTSWSGVLRVDPMGLLPAPDSGAKLKVEVCTTTACSAVSATHTIDLDPKAGRFLLTQLPTPAPLVNGTSYRLSLILKRTGTAPTAALQTRWGIVGAGPVTRQPLASERVVVTPGTASFLPTSPTVFMHGYGGRADITGTFADSLDFARFTLGWEFGGRFCLPATGTVLTPLVDNTFTSATNRASTDPLVGKYGATICTGLAGTPTLGTAAPDFFTVDFGHNFADYTTATDGLARQANEVGAVLDSLFAAVPLSPKVALVGQGTGGLAARRYMATTQDSTRVSRLVTIEAPHLGSDTAYWCGAANAAGTALGGVFGRLVSGLNLGGACGVSPADGVRDTAFTCVSGAPLLSSFLATLGGTALPASVTYVSSLGFWEAGWNSGALPTGGQRGVDCLSRTWDGLVPTESATLTDIAQPIGLIESDRFTEAAGNDVSTVFCGLNSKCLAIRLTSSEADLAVTISGRTVSRTRAEIPGAAYMTRSGPAGTTVAWVVLPLAAAAEAYTVSITSTVAAPVTVYDLEFSVGGGAWAFTSRLPGPESGDNVPVVLTPDTWTVTVP